MPKRDDSPAVSLFSFQDIITSLTGIMFMIVLLLMLIILDSNDVSPVDPETEEKITVPALTKQLEELRRQLAALTLSEDSLQKKIEAYLAIDIAELQKKISETSIRINLTKEKIKEETEREIIIQQTIKSAEEKIELLRTDIQNFADSESLKKRLEQLKQEEAELQTLLEEQQKVVQYSIEKNASGKAPVLVECSAQELVVFHTGTHARKVFTGNSFREAGADFLAWVEASCKPATVYFILMLKPAVFKEGQELNNRLAEKSFERGCEILPSDTSSIFEKKETK